MEDIKINIDKPHNPYGRHVDVIVPLPSINGAQKVRIGESGEIVSEEVGVKGGFWTTIK